MKQEVNSIAMLRKKFDLTKNIKSDTKNIENEGKASSTSNLIDVKSKSKIKYESLSNERLVKIIKSLRKENKILKKINEKQLTEIKELSEKLNKSNVVKEENSPRPQSCLRTSNSAPKKNRVVFSRDLVHVLNEEVGPKYSKTMKSSKNPEDPASCYNSTVKKITKKIKTSEAVNSEKNSEESEYFTPMSSSLQEKKIISQTFLKHYDYSPKSKEKQKLFIKINKP